MRHAHYTAAEISFIVTVSLYTLFRNSQLLAFHSISASVKWPADAQLATSRISIWFYLPSSPSFIRVYDGAIASINFICSWISCHTANDLYLLNAFTMTSRERDSVSRLGDLGSPQFPLTSLYHARLMSGQALFAVITSLLRSYDYHLRDTSRAHDWYFCW